MNAYAKILVALVASAVAAATGCAAAASGASGASATRIIIYSPFTPTGELASRIVILGSVSGSCWSGSLASPRSDAWRCMSGNAIHDPCYSGGASWVACPTGWFGRKVLRVRLTQPLPTAHGNAPLNTAKSDPEQVVLTNGVRCSFSTGATATVAGLRLNYSCTNGGWLVGSPNRSKAAWTILYLPSVHSNHFSPAAIASAWW